MTESSSGENGGVSSLRAAAGAPAPPAAPPVAVPLPAEPSSWEEALRAAPMSDWRAAVADQVRWLETECAREGRQAPVGVDGALEIARRAITHRRRVPRRVWSWWSGWDAERAWRAVHAAEVELVAASSVAGLSGRLAGVREQVASELPASDRRRKALEQFDAKGLKKTAVILGEQAGATTPRHAGVIVADALRAAFTVADDALRRVRILRNQMLVFGALLTLLNVVLGVLGSVSPALVPLCVGEVCPVHAGATAADVWVVQLFGVFGAVIAVVVLLVNGQPHLITYGLTGYQSLVKIALGATLAVVGVLVLAVGTVGALVGNRPALLVAALVFGYSQQVATRMLDSTADRLVDRARTGGAAAEPA